MNKYKGIDRVSDFLRAKHACPYFSAFCLLWNSFRWCCIFDYQGYIFEIIVIIFYTDAQLWFMTYSGKKQNKSCDMTDYSCTIPRQLKSSNGSPVSSLVVPETLDLAMQLSETLIPDTASVGLTVHLSFFNLQFFLLSNICLTYCSQHFLLYWPCSY